MLGCLTAKFPDVRFETCSGGGGRSARHQRGAGGVLRHRDGAQRADGREAVGRRRRGELALALEARLLPDACRGRDGARSAGAY